MLGCTISKLGLTPGPATRGFLTRNRCGSVVSTATQGLPFWKALRHIAGLICKRGLIYVASVVPVAGAICGLTHNEQGVIGNSFSLMQLHPRSSHTNPFLAHFPTTD